MPSSTVLNPVDQSELNRISKELDDPAVSTARLFEMLEHVTEIAKRYDCDLPWAARTSDETWVG